MSTTSPSPDSLPEDTGGRLTTGWLVTLLVLLLVAVPAAAAVLIENFFRSDVEVAEACFAASAGADVAASDLISFDAEATVTDADTGVGLLQQTTSVTAHPGDRLLYSEAVVFTNDCAGPVTVTLQSADDPAGAAAVDTGAAFAGLNVRFYVADAAGGSVTGLAGTWTEALSVLDGTPTQGGSVTIGAGGSAALALLVDADADASVGTTGSLRWVAAVDVG